jgi:uncharacterized membrane protein YphA (DoxX/SURF4 family)
MLNKSFILIRVLLGLIFIVSGAEKAIGPSENFLYVIQGYAILPDVLARLAALVFPWVELFLGVFILLGLWLDWVFKGLLLMSGALILMVGQAIVRKLPLDNCGCFGNLVHLPLKGVIILDVTIFVLTLVSLININRARSCSLDALYSKNKL